jgi:hypothetical protein
MAFIAPTPFRIADLKGLQQDKLPQFITELRGNLKKIVLQLILSGKDSVYTMTENPEDAFLNPAP